MKVKLKTCMAGPAGSFLPGDIVEDDGTLVKGGYAEPIEQEQKQPEMEPPAKDGEVNEVKNDNPAGSGATHSGGSKKVTKGRK